MELRLSCINPLRWQTVWKAFLWNCIILLMNSLYYTICKRHMVMISNSSSVIFKQLYAASDHSHKLFVLNGPPFTTRYALCVEILTELRPLFTHTLTYAYFMPLPLFKPLSLIKLVKILWMALPLWELTCLVCFESILFTAFVVMVNTNLYEFFWIISYLYAF